MAGAVDAEPGRLHRFSVPLTSFIGRASEVAEVAGLLGGYRMVTVAGPGGVGKTRLAAEVAAREAARFADGVWLIELAAVTDSGQVAAATAAALGVPQAPGVEAADSLMAAICGQQLLLVLDNCEHVAGAVAGLCGTLLRSADDVRVLATSREPVGVAGEARYRLRPLSVPGPEMSGSPDGRDGAELAGSEAIDLFVDRARRVDPHFTLTAQIAPHLAAVHQFRWNASVNHNIRHGKPTTWLQHPERFDEQILEPFVGKHLEPVVARALAVLEARRRADGAMLLE